LPNRSGVADSPFGTKHISGEHWFGSTTKEEFDKLEHYLWEKDSDAFMAAWIDGVIAQTVTAFKDGESVYVEGRAMGIVKVRRQGETKEYWTNVEAVR
jgi:hypothetical protein